MDFLEKLDYLMEQNSLNKSTLSKACGIPYTTIDGWYKKGFEGLKLTTLRKLASFFGTTLDYWTDNNDPSKQTSYSKAEKDMIKKYRTLDEHGKRIVDFNLDEEYRRMTNNKVIYESDIEQEEPFADIPFYSIGASAGTGLWLFDDIECITIQIPYTDESRRADFALPVRGDSMEPKYHDGDLLLIRQQPSIDIGEIGIFVLNDEGYVKKQGEHELISLNDNYDNINVSEFDSIYCKGKVVGCIPAEEAKKYLP